MKRQLGRVLSLSRVFQAFRFLGQRLFFLLDPGQRVLRLPRRLRRLPSFGFRRLSSAFQFIQPVIFIHSAVNERNFRFQPFQLRLSGLGLLFQPDLPRLLLLQLHRICAARLKFDALFLNLVGPFVGSLRPVPRLFAGLLPLNGGAVSVFVIRYDSVSQFQRRLDMQIFRFRILNAFQLFGPRGVLFRAQIFHRNQNLFACIVIGLEFCLTGFAKQGRQPLIRRSFENLPENLLPVARLGLNQLAEFPLRNHHNLGKLFRVHADDVLFHHRRNLARSGDNLSIRHFQGHLGRRIRLIAAQALGRAASDAVFLTRASEHHFYVGFRLFVRVIRAQVSSVSVPSASGIVQRVHNRVKNRRLARACFARDCIQSRFAQLRQIQRLPACIRPKRAHGQPDWSHACMPPTFFMVSCTKRTASSLIGSLCISSYNSVISSIGCFSAASSGESTAQKLRVRLLS